jgi:trans-2,3-dihydro-3-hydroxyanthranilate isomerase
VERAKPNPEGLARLTSEDGASMAYLFAPSREASGMQSGPLRLLARFFFPQGPAVLEDPATGSATANLGGWFLATHRALPVSVEISQGEQTGRPSRLYLEVDPERRIRVSGAVIELGRGTISM